MQKQCPYPGFDETGNFYDPAPPIRVRYDGQEFANRNKGSIDLFVDKKHTHIIPPPPSPRLPSWEAKQNYDISRNGHIGNLLGGSGQPPAEEACPVARLTLDSLSIAEAHKGQQMNNLLVNYGKSKPLPPPNPRVHHDGESNLDLNRGGRISALLYNPSSIPDAPRNLPRVHYEAEKIAEKGIEGSMNDNFHHYGEPLTPSLGVPRVKPAAEDVARLGKGLQMRALFHDYGQQGLPQPQPKVKDGKKMAELDKGGRMSRLMQDIESFPASRRAKPRVARRKNTKQGRDSVSSILTETSKWYIVPKVGVRH